MNIAAVCDLYSVELKQLNFEQTHIRNEQLSADECTTTGTNAIRITTMIDQDISILLRRRLGCRRCHSMSKVATLSVHGPFRAAMVATMPGDRFESRVLVFVQWRVGMSSLPRGTSAFD